MAAMFIVGVAVVISRRPDAVSNPQFWAEDGKNWFADAYNLGAQAFLKSNEGYLSLLPRLVAAPVTGMSLGHAALVFNLVGLVMQVAPAVFFLSRRFEPLVPSALLRAVMGLAYVVIPNYEVNVTLTNAQWHLAILALMVLIARPAQGIAVKALDAAVLLLCGLTGPFALILLPAAVARAATVAARRRWFAGLSAMLLVTLAIQGIAGLMGHRDPVPPLGISFTNAVAIVADRIVLAATFAENQLHLYTPNGALDRVVAVLICLAALGIIGFALVRGGAGLRIFVLACLAISGLGMLSPIEVRAGMSPWMVLAISDGGERYFLTAEMAWLVCLVFTISRIPRRRLRTAAFTCLTASFASGLFNSWPYLPYVDMSPAVYSAQLQHAAPGTTLVIPINPRPEWELTLTRR